MIRWLWLLCLLGCPDYHDGWARAHDYYRIKRVSGVTNPTVGPSVCNLGFQGVYYDVIRYPVPEERCGLGIKVLLLVCCRDDGYCYGEERVRTCEGVIPPR